MFSSFIHSFTNAGIDSSCEEKKKKTLNCLFVELILIVDRLASKIDIRLVHQQHLCQINHENYLKYENEKKKTKMEGNKQ